MKKAKAKTAKKIVKAKKVTKVVKPVAKVAAKPATKVVKPQPVAQVTKPTPKPVVQAVKPVAPVVVKPAVEVKKIEKAPKPAKKENPNAIVMPKNPNADLKFGVIGDKDISSRFTSKKDNAWRPTKPGGRNGNGKP